MQPRFYTTAEVAALCRTSPETVRYWRHVGYGPVGVKVGRRVLYEVTVIEAWLKALAEGQAPTTAARRNEEAM